jgi:hypothetical protein
VKSRFFASLTFDISALQAVTEGGGGGLTEGGATGVRTQLLKKAA